MCLRHRNKKQNKICSDSHYFTCIGGHYITGDRVPDEKTIWLYEDMLAKSEAGKELFDLFFEAIAEKGYVTRAGSIVDASFVEAPKRKNTKEQREKLKMGEIPEE